MEDIHAYIFHVTIFLLEWLLSSICRKIGFMPETYSEIAIVTCAVKHALAAAASGLQVKSNSCVFLDIPATLPWLKTHVFSFNNTFVSIFLV